MSSDSAPLDAAVAEKKCGDDPSVNFGTHTVEELARFADCTVLVGRFQDDSVRGPVELASLRNVRRVEGAINVFRSPRGHDASRRREPGGGPREFLRPHERQLRSIAALRKLRTVTGNLHILLNPMLPQSEVDERGARVAVGGVTTLVLPAAAISSGP